MRIRPCIDIHDGRVKQIVGSSLRDNSVESSGKNAAEDGAKKGVATKAGQRESAEALQENFVAAKDADFYASVYRKETLPGGHIILLNSIKDEEAYAADKRQALLALKEYPGGMQAGGGITPETADGFLQAGASHVIVTSYVFRNGDLDRAHLDEMVRAAGRAHLVLDLSCRRQENGSYAVVTDRWQKLTNMSVTAETLDFLAEFCDEFLIHAADVEGKRAGVEERLAELLGSWQQKSGFPVTYAGGVHAVSDLRKIAALSGGRMDVTVGSALDLFGGNLSLKELKEAAKGWNRSEQEKTARKNEPVSR